MSRCREKGLFIYKNYRRGYITNYLQLFPGSPMPMLLHRRSIEIADLLRIRILAQKEKFFGDVRAELV
jgi:hypothetical protein